MSTRLPQIRPIGGHGVRALDRTDGDHVLVGPLVPHHADRLDGRRGRAKYCQRPLVGAGAPRSPRGRSRRPRGGRPGAPPCNLARDANGRGRGPGTAGGRRTRVRHAELAADGPHLVLEEVDGTARGARKPSFSGRPPYVVMRLDRHGLAHRRRTATLDDVGIERPLGEPVRVRHVAAPRAPRRPSTKSVPDPALRFSSGSVMPASVRHEVARPQSANSQRVSR